MTAAAQLRRVLRLVPLVADDRPHPVAELAAALECDRDTLLGDLHSLAARYDDPGGFVAGLQVFLDGDTVQVRSDHFLRPLRLTVRELRALELGLALLEGERAPEELRAIAGARARLAAVLARVPDDPVHHADVAADLGDLPSRPWLAPLRRALREHAIVTLTYAGSSGPAERRVHPYALTFRGGSWYLVAWCERSGAPRVFRLDRVEGLELTPERFAPRTDLDLDALLAGDRLLLADGAGTLRVRYGPQVAGWVAERHGLARDADGSVTVEHPLADRAWAVRHVLQYGPDATVLAPAEVADEVRRRAAGVAAMLAGG